MPRQLGTDVRRALLDFHSKYYSANLMALTVLSRFVVTPHDAILFDH